MAVNISSEYSISYKFQCALALPICRRCDEVIVLMNECSFKDAHSLYPLLVESIFGFGSHPGWGVGLLFRNVQPRDFDTLRYFLCPSGPLMRFIYKLTNDAYLKYEFPTQCLPSPVQRTLESGIVPPVYLNKLQSQMTLGKLPSYLLLNPFEFYIFHMAYFLIGSQTQKNRIDWRDQGECLYVHLVEDFLHYFLPCDGSMTSAFQSSPIHKLSSSPSSNKKIERSQTASSPFRLFKQIPVARQSSTTSLLSKDVGQTELWRNEVVAQSLIDFWLNHFNFDAQPSAMSSPDKVRGLFLKRGTSLQTVPHFGMPQNAPFDSSFFPSTVHVRLVRMLVKHIHYFSNNANSVSVSPLDDFKKAIIPQLLQKNLYTFIKHLFDHWPLDASFKLVLELWLSYIQPWRYINMRAANNAGDDKDRVVLYNWQPFVEENVMFYSRFFQKMVQRLLRVDLVSPKNAHMLQRLCKVFSQTNLCQLIKVAESLLMESTFRILPSNNISNRSLLARAASEAGHAAIIRQRIVDLEGPNYSYVPMFGEKSTTQVKLLVMDINRAREQMKMLKRNATSIKSGWLAGALSSIENFFMLNYDQPNVKSDEEKVAQFLEYGAQQLSHLFQIQMRCEDVSMQEPIGDASFSSFRSFEQSGEISDTDLSLSRCIDLLNRTCTPSMEFRGDPDLQLIRSYEIAPLVRILHQLSSLINDQFALEIQHLYERRDFVGKVSRQMIQPPRLCVSYSHDGLPSPTREKVLPPRISLRPFAAKHNVGYLLAAYAVPFVFGYNRLFTVTFVYLFFAFVYLILKAWKEPDQLQVAN